MLKIRLSDENISLDLAHGKLSGNISRQIHEVNLPWAKILRVHTIAIFGQKLYWQNCFSFGLNYDLIIIQQSNREIISWMLILLKPFYRYKLGVIGHGLNLQNNYESFGNKLKRYFLNSFDWWFAYNDLVKKFLITHGISKMKITSFNNAIDTAHLKDISSQLRNEDLLIMQEKYNISSKNTVIFCGGMYEQKRLDFLLEACPLIRQKIKDFNIIFIGAGEDEKKVVAFAATHDWAHYLGTSYDDKEKSYLFALSKLLLMPGLVGLVVLDSFTLETPLVTTSYPFHSPEVDYIVNEYNGIITHNNVIAYSEKVIDLLSDEEKLTKLQSGCKHSSQKYTIQKMVNLFGDGVLNALK